MYRNIYNYYYIAVLIVYGYGVHSEFSVRVMVRIWY